MWQFIGRKHSAGNKHHLLEEVDNGNAHPPVEASTAPTALTVVASQWRKAALWRKAITVEKSQHRRLERKTKPSTCICCWTKWKSDVVNSPIDLSGDCETARKCLLSQSAYLSGFVVVYKRKCGENKTSDILSVSSSEY